MVASIFDWSVTAADNDDADTDINWLEGQQGSTVNNSARAMMAKVAAVVKMMRGAYTTTNTGDAYVLAVDFPPASLAKGWFGVVRFNATNTGAATLELTPLAATTLRDAEGTALGAGAIIANSLYLVVYDATASQYRLVSKVSTTLTSANITDFTEAVQDVLGALTGFGGTGLTFTYDDGAGTIALAVTLSELDAEATIATDDYIAIVDTSASSASDKMLVSDFLKVVNSLTEDASPDTANDFLLSYDASAGTAKKVKPDSILSGVPDGITLATEQASTSGTSIDFTSIPAGVKRITVMLDEVSFSGGASFTLQLGDSGGLENTGYKSSRGQILSAGTSSAVINTTTSFILGVTGTGNDLITGCAILTLMDGSNTWVLTGTFMVSATVTNAVSYVAGRKTLSGTLDRLSIAGGTFDAGEINIAYE